MQSLLEKHNPDGPKILVADDDEDVRLLLRLNLQKANFQVVEAGDGLEAIAQVKHEQPLILILDWMMPNLDGIEACRQIRAHNKRVYIIMLSAVDSYEQRAEALEAGANDYRTKPMSGKKLVALLQEIVFEN